MSTSITLYERPRLGPYIGLSLPFFLIFFLYLLIFLTKPNVSVGFPIAISLAVATLFTIWITGHQIKIMGGKLTYRNGFYQKTVVSIDTIKSIKAGHSSYENLGSAIKIPSLMITHGEGTLHINPALFRPGLARRIRQTIGS